MAVEKQYQKTIKQIAEGVLGVFSKILSNAISKLESRASSDSSSLSSVNTFTSDEAIRSHRSAIDAVRKDLDVLSREPAIARILVEREDGERVIYYICRAAPTLISPLKKALLTGFHFVAKHIVAKAVSPSSETMRTI